MRRTRKNPFETILSEAITDENIDFFCQGLVYKIELNSWGIEFNLLSKDYVQSWGGSKLSETFGDRQVCEAILQNMWVVLKCVNQVFREEGYPPLRSEYGSTDFRAIGIHFNLTPDSLEQFKPEYAKIDFRTDVTPKEDSEEGTITRHTLTYNLFTANDVRNKTQIIRTVRNIVEVILEKYGTDVRGLKVPTTVKTIVNSFAPNIRSVSAKDILNPDLIEEEAVITESSPTTEIDSGWTPTWTESVVETFDEDAETAALEALAQARDLSKHVSAGDITQEEAQEEALDIQITAEAAKDTAQAYEQLGLFDNTEDENAPQEVIEAADEVLEATKTILITTRGQKSKLLGSDKSIKVTKKPKPKPEPKPKSEPEPKSTLQTVSFNQSMFGELSGISLAPTGSFGSIVKKLHSALAKYLTWEDVRASVKFTFKEGTRDSVSVNSKSAIITLSSSATAKSALPLLAEAMERLYEANDFEFEDTQVNIEYLLGTYMN